jgi:hypothetical protein
MNAPSNLLILASADRPLNPAQRKFNQLVRKIDGARAELLAWQEQVPLYAQGHVQRVRPLLADIAAHRRMVLDRLDAMLAQKGWTKAERRTMRGILCQVAADLIEDDETDEAEIPRLKALHDKHADTDFDTENRDSVAAMKELFEVMSGVDLGDEAFDSEDALMQRAHERMRADHQARAEDEAQAPPAAARRKSAAQRRRDSQAQEASQSVREVYRKLASALHPDRASDEADRTTRTALMKRVNQAYDAKDLLGLFALQLEIEQVDAAHLAQATAERARHYNQVLSAQLAELLAEVQMRQAAFCMDFGIDPFQRIQPQALGKLLDREVAEWRAALADADLDLRMLAEPVTAKRWLKQMRQQQQELDDDMMF